MKRSAWTVPLVGGVAIVSGFLPVASMRIMHDVVPDWMWFFAGLPILGGLGAVVWHFAVTVVWPSEKTP